MKIIVGNNKSKVIFFGNDFTKDFSVKDALKDYMAILSDDFYRSPAYQSGKWDGYTHFFTYANYFPTGLLNAVIKFCYDRGIDYLIEDKREHAVRPLNIYPDYLRDDYQVELLEKMLINFIDNLYFPRGIIDGATNAGKDFLMSALIDNYPEANILLLLHNVDIFDKAVEHFKEYNPDLKIGTINKKGFSPERFTIAMYKTLLNKSNTVNGKRLIKSTQILMVDECHRSGAKDYKQLINKIPAYVRYFFSGTPLERKKKENNLRIVGMSGNKLCKISNKKLIDMGYSTKPKILIYENNETCVSTNYNDNYNKIIIESEDRMKVMKDYCDYYNKVLIPVKFKEHGYYIKEHIPEVVLLYSGDKKRKQKIKDFKEGRIKILVTTLLQEGVNIKGIEVMLLGIAGLSIIKLKQYIGRCLRWSNLDQVIVVDWNDKGYHMQAHTAQRLELYRKEQFEIEKGY